MITCAVVIDETDPSLGDLVSTYMIYVFIYLQQGLIGYLSYRLSTALLLRGRAGHGSSSKRFVSCMVVHPSNDRKLWILWDFMDLNGSCLGLQLGLVLCV